MYTYFFVQILTSISSLFSKFNYSSNFCHIFNYNIYVQTYYISPSPSDSLPLSHLPSDRLLCSIMGQRNDRHLQLNHLHKRHSSVFHRHCPKRLKQRLQPQYPQHLAQIEQRLHFWWDNSLVCTQTSGSQLQRQIH